MSVTAALSRRPWSLAAPWLAGLIVAAAFCSGYVLMGVYRKKWQNHFPELAAKWANNGRFALVAWYGTELANEEIGFASRVVEASREFPAYDPYIKDNRTRPQALIDPLSNGVMGLVHKATGDINKTWLAVRFLACLSWFLLIYFVMLRIGQSPPFAFFCGVTIALFSYLMCLLWVSAWDWSNPLKCLWAMLTYGRTEGVMRLPRPGVTYGFLFLGTLLAIKSAEKPGWFWPIVSGLMGGLMAYVRLDVWTSHVLALPIFALIWSYRQKKIQIPLVVACVIAGLISLPFFLSFYPPNPNLVAAADIQPRREFDPNSIVYLVCTVLLWRFRRGPAELFLGAMNLANFAMVNIELVVGYPMQPEHWKFFANLYVFLTAMAFVPEKWKKVEAPWALAGCAMIVAAFLQGVSYASMHFPFQGIPKHYDEALDWLKGNTPEDAVVFTLNPEVVALLPVYAHKKVLAGRPLPTISIFPLKDNFKRYAGGAKLLGVDLNKLLDDTAWKHRYMNDRRGVVAAGLYRGQIEKHDFYTFFAAAPEKYAREVAAEAIANPSDVLPDLIWYGHLEREYSSKQPPFLKSKAWREVYKNPMVTLYSRL